MEHSVIPITVVVPVRNEERAIRECLMRLGRFQHVVVLDSHSDDRTAQIAEDMGAEVIQFMWDGMFPKKRNWYLANFDPPTRWILFLDADEYVSEAFCAEALAAVATGTHSGYWLRYTNFFMGRPLRFGDPQRKLALFKVGHAMYERIEEDSWSGLDMEVHEHPVVDGTTGTISAKIEHRDDRGVAKFVERHREYALWESKRFLTIGCQPAQKSLMTARQRRKYKLLSRWWLAPAYFLFSYFGRLGFLDGRAGLQFATLKMWYFHLIYLLLLENRTGYERAKAGHNAS